jgi:hypothetical protein
MAQTKTAPKRPGILSCTNCSMTTPFYHPEPETWPTHRCRLDNEIHPFSKFTEGKPPKQTFPK